MAGLVPAIPMRKARCVRKRDTRDKPAYDDSRGMETALAVCFHLDAGRDDAGVSNLDAMAVSGDRQVQSSARRRLAEKRRAFASILLKAPLFQAASRQARSLISCLPSRLGGLAGVTPPGGGGRAGKRAIALKLILSQ